jgi:hypothetical protein
MRFVGMFVGCLALVAPCAAQVSPVLSPDARVEGRSQAEWSSLWWQWAGSFERDDSPVGDRTGDKCHFKQSGSVWFLAGTYGSHRVVRTCTVPRGRHLFFPIINYVVMPGGKRRTCASVTLSARWLTDNPAGLVLDIDGRPVAGLERHRQASPRCFDVAARAASSHRVFPSAANGYYVMLAPLPPGKHVLNFGGVLPSLAQAVTYTLHVE